MTVAPDGKALKVSFDHMEDRKAAQVPTEFSSEAAIMLVQADIADKESEIPAVQTLSGH
jgi:hypothetical protein